MAPPPPPPHPLTIQALAESLSHVNHYTDPERLVVQYPHPNTEKPAANELSPETLRRILIPRERGRGDILFTLADPDNDKEREKEKEKGKDSSSSSGVTLYHKTQGEIERWMKTPHVPGEGEEQALVLSKPLIIPGIDARIPREFGAIVEAAHRGVAGPNNDFIPATLRALAHLAGNIYFESWNTEDDITSSPLSAALLAFAASFPPKLPGPVPPVPSSPSSPSSSPSPSPSSPPSSPPPPVKAYLLTLTRLLTLLHASPSSAPTDLRIWELAGQLLALAAQNELRIPQRQFALRFGLFLVKGSLDFLSGGGGGGGPLDPNATGTALTPPPPAGPPRRGWTLGKKIGIATSIASLAAIAINPALLLVPAAEALGFGALGPVAGGAAAAWQASMGVGGLFGMLQGIGMAGAASAAGGPLLVGVGGVAGVGAGVLGRRALREVRGEGGGGEGGQGEEGWEGDVEFVVRIVLLSVGVL